MDISALKPSERMLDILHPATKNPIGVIVTILCLHDERMKKIRRQIQDEGLRLERRGKGFKSTDIEDNENSLAYSAMVGWEWKDDANFHGKKPEFNRANVIQVLEELLWFKQQILEAVGDEEAFFQI